VILIVAVYFTQKNKMIMIFKKYVHKAGKATPGVILIVVVHFTQKNKMIIKKYVRKAGKATPGVRGYPFTVKVSNAAVKIQTKELNLLIIVNALF
jgi:hypothetical protein